MVINTETKVGDIVKANFKTAQIFEKNKIDFCCNGGTSLLDACSKLNLNVDTIIPELEMLVTLNDADSKYINSLELNELCDYIEKRHHSYVNETIPFLQQKLQKLCEVHGKNHMELFELKQLFEGAAENLSTHMKTEELILFPYILRMVKSKNNAVHKNLELAEIQETLAVLNDEHKTEGARFEKIASLTNQYTCPPDGCATFKVTFQTLHEFEQDLHRHIHLENNILFPKALLLEKELSINK